MKDFLKKIFNREKSIFSYFLTVEPTDFTGALLDDRGTELKKEDIHFSEIVASASPVNWVEKKTVRKFPVLNQLRSFSCGAQALSKSIGIALKETYGTYIQLSRSHIYQRRVNKGSPGMALWDMFKIAAEGTCLEAIVSSPLVTEYDYDNAVIEPWMRKEGETWAVSGGVYLPNNIDLIASVIQVTKKAPILLTYFLNSEWSKNVPVVQNRNLGAHDPSALRHFVVAVDYTLYQGSKTLAIEDSAHFGGISERLVTEDWVKTRVIGAGYPMNFKFSFKAGMKPTYDGMTIISAQQCLEYEGFFPTNISKVENVGPTTKKAILGFQKKYGLNTTQSLDEATKNKLHEIFP